MIASIPLFLVLKKGLMFRTCENKASVTYSSQPERGLCESFVFVFKFSEKPSFLYQTCLRDCVAAPLPQATAVQVQTSLLAGLQTSMTNWAQALWPHPES